MTFCELKPGDKFIFKEDAAEVVQVKKGSTTYICGDCGKSHCVYVYYAEVIKVEEKDANV